MSRYSNPPDPFPDPNAPFAGSIVNPALPGSIGGLLESVKTAVMISLKEAVTGSSLDLDTDISVDMEYPQEVAAFPAIWVQFSITKLQRAGLSHEVMTKSAEGNWEPVQEWIFEGRITITIAALTSLERDRISDRIISLLAFARPPMLVLTDPTKDTKQYRSLLTSLAENPYVSLTLNTDSMIPGGQTVTQAPYDPENLLVYEDNYSMDMVGNFGIKFRNDGLYELTQIGVKPTPFDPYEGV